MKLIIRLFTLIRFIDIFSKFTSKFLINNLKEKSRSNIFIKPKISIILPIYNSEYYLNSYLTFLLNQNFKSIEIICIDYGSKDQSLFILNKYKKIDNRIIILSQYKENTNTMSNNGIKIAKGEYLLFLNIGIFFPKDILYDIIKEADKENVDIIIYGFEKYNKKLGKYLYENLSFQKKIWPKECFNYSINSNHIFTSFYPFLWNKIFRNTFIKNNNLYFLDKIDNINLFFINIALIRASKMYIFNKYAFYYQEDMLDKTQFINTLYPLNFYKKLLKLKKYLEEQNYFLQIEEIFKIFIKKVCIYYLKNNEEQNIFIYEKLKKKKFQKLGIEIIPTDLISHNFHEKYLDHFYFKHINMINEKFQVDIIKNTNYQFKAKVSVIIPVYNSEEYIIKCLDSIIKQKLEEIEIIVVNDGSTDNSLQIVQNFIQNDNRFLILSQMNRGLSEARNTGFGYSKGEYIYFIDSDDYLDENCLLDLYNEAISNNLDIIFFDANSFLEEMREKISSELIKKFNNYINYYHRKGNYEGILNGTQMFFKMKQEKEYRTSVCLQFIKKKFYINAGLSFYPGIVHEDNLFTFIAILLANRTIYLNKTYYNRRVRLNSIMTNSVNVKNLYGYFIVYCEILKFLEKNNFTGDIKLSIKNEMNEFINRISYIYNKITNDEKNILFKKITIYQEIILNNLLIINEYKGTINVNIKDMEKLNKENKKNKKKKKIYFCFLLFNIFVSLFLLISKKKITVAINFDNEK